MFRVDGHSMLPTLRAGQVVLTRPRAAGSVRRGHIVLAQRQGLPLVVKRVAAVAGDVVEMTAARVHVNINRADPEATSDSGTSVATWTVPSGHYFLTGDNSGWSTDSRSWDQPFVRHEEIAGVVLFTGASAS